MSPLNPKVGDLVQLAIMFTPGTGLSVYERWGGKSSGFPDKIDDMMNDDIGLVLESLEPQGGNGCKVLFRGDKVGWVNINYIKRVYETR